MARKGQQSPRTVTTGLRQRAWWILRNRKSTTLPELLSTIADGHEKDAESNVGRYLRALVKAGILSVAKDRVPGGAMTSNGYKRYCLVVDCGEDAPVWRASRGEVYVPAWGEAGGMAGSRREQIPPCPPLQKGGNPSNYDDQTPLCKRGVGGDLRCDHAL